MTVFNLPPTRVIDLDPMGQFGGRGMYVCMGVGMSVTIFFRSLSPLGIVMTLLTRIPAPTLLNCHQRRFITRAILRLRPEGKGNDGRVSETNQKALERFLEGQVFSHLKGGGEVGGEGGDGVFFSEAIFSILAQRMNEKLCSNDFAQNGSL